MINVASPVPDRSYHQLHLPALPGRGLPQRTQIPSPMSSWKLLLSLWLIRTAGTRTTTRTLSTTSTSVLGPRRWTEVLWWCLTEAGFASWGTGCARDRYPGVFTELSYVLLRLGLPDQRPECCSVMRDTITHTWAPPWSKSSKNKNNKHKESLILIYFYNWPNWLVI